MEKMAVITPCGFQFPSNGKVEPKDEPHDESGSKILVVSIPFKRESGAKEILVITEQLENRNNVSIPFKRESGAKDRKDDFVRPIEALNTLSFNSLQTGKWSQSLPRIRSLGCLLVSIPFKRESGAKGCSTRMLV